MDDYNVSVLSEAKNEYSLRLVSILYPLVLEGIKSILKEAWELCLTNDEEEKYLMTFQNFLSRVTKWNQTIIDVETARVLNKSGCPYLEDLLTCVHITQLKILTSIRVSQKQKKIELDIPKLSTFIHKIYINCARKFYSNVYLFEQKIAPLQYQKNMRECETICKECILDVIRDNMPVEHILRSYMDESIEEEIIEEEVPKTKEDLEEEVKEAADKAQAAAEAAKSSEAKAIEVKKTENLVINDVSGAIEGNTSVVAPADKKPIPILNVETPVATSTEPMVMEITPKKTAAPTPSVSPSPMPSPKPTPTIDAITTPKPLEAHVLAPPPPTKQDIVKEIPRNLSFDDVDKVFDHETLQENLVEAPKNIERLEEISKMRTAQRKAEEEEEEENIKIHSTEDANIELDILSL